MMVGVTVWEYARLDYTAAGSFGADREMDWIATFYSGTGGVRWGTDERFNDIKHLDRAGRDGWQAYHRAALVIGQPQRLQAVTYSFKRPVG